MSKLIDNAITMRVLWMLTTPFDRTDAYRLGIIDKTGKEIKPISKLNTDVEREAYTYLHRLVFRLKRIIHMVPVESKNFLSFAAAVALVKEGVEYDEDILEELFYMAHQEPDAIALAEDLENRTLSFRQFVEEMGVGGGGIAGIGIPNPTKANQAEPGVSKKAQANYKKKKKIIRRNAQ
jgi:hypothetical protein